MKNIIGEKGFISNGPVDGTSELIIPQIAASTGTSYTLVVDDSGKITSTLAPNATASFALSTAQWNDLGNSLNTTSSVAIVGGLGSAYDVSDVGNNVYFYVSGAVDKVAVFGGDLLVSGAVRNTALRVSQFIELAPTATPPVHDGSPGFASTFLYTTGSDSDLIIHHYNGYDNAINFRWIENNLSTGLLKGGILSTEPGTTTFSIASGSGLFVKYNATPDKEPTTTTVVLEWPAYISQSLTYINSSSITYVGIAEDGALVQQLVPFQNADYQNYIVLGRVTHNSGSTLASNPLPKVSYGQTTWTSDFSRAFGPLKIRGHVLAASGSTLGLTKTNGSSYAEGRNYVVDADSPNLVLPATDGNVNTSKIYRIFVSGSDSLNYTFDYGVAGAGYQYIDPTKYNPNNNGTLTSVTAGYFSIQRVFWSPNSETNAFYVYYGPQEYATLGDAQTAISSEIFVESAITTVSLIYVAAVIARNDCTNLSDPTKALIIQGGLFRAGGIGAGGGAPSSLVVPGGINTYVQFNDGGSVFGGNSALTFNKTTGVLTSNTLNTTTNATVTKLTASVGIITPFLSAGIGFRANGTGVVATGSFTGSFTGVLTGTASFSSNAGLLNSLASSAFPQLATANTFTQNNTFTTVTASAISSSGNVQIGGNISVVGITQATGSAFFAGNVTLGDAAADIITSTGRLTASAGLALTGASTFAAGSTFTFSGNTVHTGGLSGSLQRLSDGTTPYIVAGANITINTASNGQVSITGSAVTETSSSWTPAFFFEGLNGSHTYSAQLGSYYKIGKLVTVNFIIALSALGTSTGNVDIVNLPFTSQTTNVGCGVGVVAAYKNISNGNKITSISTWVNSNTTTSSLFITKNPDVASLRLTHAELTNTTEITGSITYIAAS